jgi:hypothetical protein
MSQSDAEDGVESSLPDDSPSSPTSSLRTNLKAADSQYLYEVITSLLANEETRLTITEDEFREYLREQMADKMVILNDAAIAARLRAAGEAAKEVRQQEAIVEQLYSQWAHNRDAFTSAQALRREQRRMRAGRTRTASTRVVMDSEEEFEDVEPRLHCSPLKLAGAAAHEAYLEVRERFVAEKAKRRSDASTLRKELRVERNRERRRGELMSSLPSPFASAANDSTSSSSSLDDTSLSTPKRKFVAAGVTEAYTQFLASSAQRTAEAAAGMKAAIDREAALTAAYRERKLMLLGDAQKSREDFRLAVLEEIRGGKENEDPNTESDAKEGGVTQPRQRGLLSALLGL